MPQVLSYTLFKFLFLFVITGCDVSSGSRIEHIRLQSKIFGNTRTLRVYLPKAYDGTKTFKVLYLNDGQNLFGDNDTGADNEWRIDEIVDSLVHENAIEPLIVVGIDHAGKDRANEYLPWEDIYLTPPLPNPAGEKYPAFITTEVIPLLEQTYQVKKGKENRGLGGASYGSLISLYTLMHQPEWFGFALIESPSLYVHEQALLTLAESKSWSWPENIYIGIGTNELNLEDCHEENEDNQMAVDDVKRLEAIIHTQSPASNIQVWIDSCATHHENAWSNRFPEALQFVLNGSKVTHTTD
jgi:predicted alpha/beta superfamily hydrolase